MGNGIFYDGVGNIYIIFAKASTEFYLLCNMYTIVIRHFVKNFKVFVKKINVLNCLVNNTFSRIAKYMPRDERKNFISRINLVK